MTPEGKTVLCEIGVGPPGMAFCLLVADRPDFEVLAFEPHPVYAAEVRTALAGRTNVTLHEVAIGDEPGTLSLYDEGTSSALAGVGSPSVQHHGDRPRKEHTVQVRRLSDYDHGQIDLLRVDTEGSEWFALKHMVSRPTQIVIEVYNDLGTYINPFLWEIVEWTKTNGYKLVNVTEGDFIYQRVEAKVDNSLRDLGPLLALSLHREPAKDLAFYERAVKGTLIASFTQAFVNAMQPDEFVTTLHRLFQRKQKAFANIAVYVKREVEERGRPLHATIQNVSFYALVLREYLDRDVNQPIVGHT